MSLHMAGLSSFYKNRVFVNMFKVNWVDKVFEHNLGMHRIPLGWDGCTLDCTLGVYLQILQGLPRFFQGLMLVGQRINSLIYQTSKPY